MKVFWKFLKFFTDNWGLKLLALMLAIIIYYYNTPENHDRHFIQTIR